MEIVQLITCFDGMDAKGLVVGKDVPFDVEIEYRTVS